MEEKRRDAGTLGAAGGEAPAPAEPTSSRRRAGGQKRKSGNLGSSVSSSAPSKRVTREKFALSHPPIHSHSHNGPLTRARQGPGGLATASATTLATEAAASGAKQAKDHARAPGGDAAAAAEEMLRKESELEALEAELEAKFESIRSRPANAHVVPSHCGWFSWTNIHPVEERTLPSFFNGKSDLRTPETYLEIRNWIMRKFHANPSTQIELKDLSELEAADLDARQEVLEFLDYWGLINFHLFPQMGSATDSANGDGSAEKVSLADKLYHFETPQSSKPVIPKNNVTAPAVPSRLFPESTIAEELMRLEGPGVEYHCNSCSADCSRKRYHCQKQADFDLCSECFSNKKFDSGMSSSDFILMEPGEIPGLSGGKWTDQETLLLLEALELYKENWSEIAEHVATKTKAQCILHFVQMPIEDSFLAFDDDVDSSSKETANPASSEKDSSAAKDNAEATEGETAANESKAPTSPMETQKEEMTVEKASQETSKTEEKSDEKNEEKTSQDSESKDSQETGENCAMKALKEAFEAVGYPLTPERPLSFAEVGNPVMTLAAFLANLVGPDLATASAHNSLKSISGNSPGIELATRHCFLLDEPPNDNKEQAELNSVAEVANGENKKEETTEHGSQKDDSSIDNCDKKVQDSTLEEKKSPGGPDDDTPEKSDNAKGMEIVVACEESGPANLDKSESPDVIKDQTPSHVRASDNLNCELEISPSSVKETEGNSGEHPEPTETATDVEMSEAHPSKNNEPQQSVALNLVTVPTHSSEASLHVDVASDSIPSKKDHEKPEIVSSAEKTPSETAKDVDMVPQQTEKSGPSQHVEAIAMGENRMIDAKEGDKEKHGTKEMKEEDKIDKIKRAAVSAISAAAVKAKLLADQEEDQIRQLSMLLVEKQLQKLETKLAFFNEMENVVLRVREQLERSRQRLYHERANIIAARLGIPASSSRMVPSSLPGNRIGVNVAGAVPRPPLGMLSQRPPMSRPVGPMAPNLSVPSSTAAGNTIQPPSQEKLSSVGTK